MCIVDYLALVVGWWGKRVSDEREKKPWHWNGGPLDAFPLEEKDDEQRHFLVFLVKDSSRKQKTQIQIFAKGKKLFEIASNPS